MALVLLDELTNLLHVSQVIHEFTFAILFFLLLYYRRSWFSWSEGCIR